MQDFMKTVKFFYAHTTQDLQVPDDTPVLTSKVDQLTSDRTGIEIVREAMENPIDSPRLCELAKGKDDCVIIISDHTRPASPTASPSWSENDPQRKKHTGIRGNYKRGYHHRGDAPFVILIRYV
jgi:hypothetical protein